MPTIAVDKADLFQALGRHFTRQEFDELCFEFGIELDEDTSEAKQRPLVNGVEEAPQLKIEIPANRYDMLCFEGIAMNLNVFLGRRQMPTFRSLPPPGGKLQVATISADTARIRPYFSAAILRNITFDQKRYDSFIALQDKLHQNLARQRTLVAIGTHDLDTIRGPFSYEALPPEQITFAPLNQTKAMNARDMMSFYEKDKHLSRFLPIIRDSPVYPIIYDSQRTVLSMPPIINSNHSKITLNTRNVFIDVTATDKTKLEIVNHMLVAMFSQYCSEPFTVEPVQILSPHNGESRITPDLSPRLTRASATYINSTCGLDLSRPELCTLLKKMCYDARPAPADDDALDIAVPITRADVLHEVDIMEDAAIAYGFNNLPRHFATTTAAALPIGKLADVVRNEAANAGWAEVMPLILGSHEEHYAWLRHDPSAPGSKFSDAEAIKLQNPKTAEYQIVRPCLVPGLLKTLRENRGHRVPMKVFEVGDVGLQAPQAERRARNERRFAAAYYGKTSGFEQVHGLLDRVMSMLRADFSQTREQAEHSESWRVGYWLEENDDPMYLPGHAATIFLRDQSAATKAIGHLGVLHPEVLSKFDLPFPASVLELNVEVFL